MSTKKRIKNELRFHALIAFSFIVFCFSFPALGAQESGFTLNVDPRLELLSVIQSLTNWPNIGGFTKFDFQYYRDVKSYFSPFKNHAMIKWYDDNLKRNWGYNAAPAAMLSLSNPPDIKLVEPFPEYIVKRGRGEENLNRMVELMNQFAIDTDFLKFWEEQQPFYKDFIDKIKEQVPYKKYNQLMKDFYGEEKANFVFIPVPLFHRGGYAEERETKEGKVAYFIGGPHEIEDDFPVYDNKIIRWLVFHEFGHSFTKPIVNEYEDRLNEYKHLFKYMKKSMKELTYTDWITTCDEHFVRCGEYFLLRLAGFPEESQQNYELNLKQGFLLLPLIREKMEVYVKTRTKFPSFKEFFPNFFEVFETVEPDLKKKVDLPPDVVTQTK